MRQEGQFSIEVREDGEVIGSEVIDDPFIHTTVRSKGWRSAWKVLTRGVTFTVHVDGTPAAVSVVMKGDYSTATGTEAVREAVRQVRGGEPPAKAGGFA